MNRHLWIGLGATALLVVTACATNPKPETNATAEATSPLAEKLAKGKAAYDRCGPCHGDDGRGDTPFGTKLGAPDFTDMSWQRTKSSADLAVSITDGHGESVGDGPSAMPAHGEALSEAQIDALVAYVRSFARDK